LSQSYQKLEIFKVQSHFLRPKFFRSSWNWFFYLNINLGEQLSIRTFSIQSILRKVYLVKLCPNFTGSDSKSLTSNQKTLSICSFGYENLLNFTWHTKNFYNRNHTIVYSYDSLYVSWFKPLWAMNKHFFLWSKCCFGNLI